MKNNKWNLIISFSVFLLMDFLFILGWKYNNKNFMNSNLIIDDYAFNVNIINNNTNDKRIIYLKKGNSNVYDIILTSLNNKDLNYELTYDLCVDEKCNNIIERTPNNLAVAFTDSNSKDNITGIIKPGKDNFKKISIVTENKTNNNYYIIINLNVANNSDELVLKHKIDDLSSYSKIMAYVNGIESSGAFLSCKYMPIIRLYNQTSLIDSANMIVTCDPSTGIWYTTLKSFATKAILDFVMDSVKPTCSLSVSGTTITASYSDNWIMGLYGFAPYYDGTTTKTINGTGTYTYYVKDYAENTNTCSLSVVSTIDEKYTTTCTKNPWVGPATNGKCSYGWYSATGWNGPGCYITEEGECEETRKACSSGYSMINDSYCYKIN